MTVTSQSLPKRHLVTDSYAHTPLPPCAVYCIKRPLLTSLVHSPRTTLLVMFALLSSLLTAAFTLTALSEAKQTPLQCANASRNVLNSDCEPVTSEQRSERGRSVNNKYSALNESCFTDWSRVDCVPETRILILAHSAPENTRLRHAIRQTWGSASQLRHYDAALYFVIGSPAEQQQQHGLSEYIIHESRLYEDIVALNIEDSYRHLTAKSLCMLQWVTRSCRDVTYVIKSDDDVYLNVSALTSFLSQDTAIRQLEDRGERYLVGHVITGASPQRSRSHKYYTHRAIYRTLLYPPFLSGSAYVIPRRVVPLLLAAAKHTSTFWLEDVFWTGIVAKASHIALVHNTDFVIAKDVKKFWGARYGHFLALHSVSAAEMHFLFKSARATL